MLEPVMSKLLYFILLLLLAGHREFENSPVLFHNRHEGSRKLASQSVYFLSLHGATSHQVALDICPPAVNIGIRLWSIYRNIYHVNTIFYQYLLQFNVIFTY